MGLGKRVAMRHGDQARRLLFASRNRSAKDFIRNILTHCLMQPQCRPMSHVKSPDADVKALRFSKRPRGLDHR